MKLVHLSDLHLGKRVNEFPMLEDQAHILEQISALIDRERPDAVLIAGDVYDRTVPSAEAVALLDEFLVALAGRQLPVLLISGNHDSAERLSFAARLMERSHVHISPVYDGHVTPVTLTDAYGPVDFFLLPFVKPVHVRRAFPEEEIESYTDAVACAIRHMALDPARRSVLLTHQFVTGAEQCESEELSVGGSDNVDASVFAPFDYVALGHIHSPQNLGGRVRYCGSPLKYSFSEAKQQKSVTVAELGEKGRLSVRAVPLTPLRDMIELRGSYLEVTARAFYQGLDRDAYIRVTLTDEDDVPDAVSKLRVIYPNLMRLDYDNRRTRGAGLPAQSPETERQPPLELFAAFYERQNGHPLSDNQRAYLAGVMESIWEETV